MKWWFGLLVVVAMLWACKSQPKRSVDIIGCWTTGASANEINWTKDRPPVLCFKSATVEAPASQRGPVPYLVVDEKPGEMELAFHPPGENKETHMFVQRSGKKLWLRSPRDGNKTWEYTRAGPNMNAIGKKNFNRIVEGMHESDAKSQMGVIRMKLETWYVTYGKYPDTLKPADIGLQKEDLIDPWGRPIRYTVNGRSWSLCSDGKDEKPKTSDDVCYEP